MLRLCTPLPQPAAPESRPFIVGVNYWPRLVNPASLATLCVDQVHEDFASLAELGIRHARVSLPASLLENCSGCLACKALAHLLALCDAAAAEGVKLELSFAPGSESADSDAHQFVLSVAHALGRHPAVFGYDLGRPLPPLADSEEPLRSQLWFEELSRVVRVLAPGRSLAMDLSAPDFLRDDGLRLDQASSSLDHSVVSPPSPSEPLPFATAETPALFSCALAGALTRKPTILRESSPSAAVRSSEQQVARHAETLLRGLVAQGCAGVYLWGFTDSATPDAEASSPRLYGLFDERGQLRPHGEVLASFAATRPKVAPDAPRAGALAIAPDAYYVSPAAHFRRLAEQYGRQLSRLRGPMATQ